MPAAFGHLVRSITYFTVYDKLSGAYRQMLFLGTDGKAFPAVVSSKIKDRAEERLRGPPLDLCFPSYQVCPANGAAAVL